ncbi:MAG: amidohydrolase family protein [Desulfotomaculaceae bacterium]|nr:amidohydrolase family protein [Desulfotomaculaceae bacterium]
MLALDSHVHCGLTIPFEEILSLWKDAKIEGGALISPVEEIYNRYDSDFVDSDYYRQSRSRVHSYLESLASRWVFAYWFVWNDFAKPREGFAGIKWHRHTNEPKYKYKSKECDDFIEHVCSLRLPVMIEDEFHNTMELVNRINRRTVVIIPHFGGLNGGYVRLKQAGLFENPMVYVDTALAYPGEIRDFAADYQVDRILFGSDYPFGDPAYERHKLERLFTGRAREQVLAQNLLALFGR